MQNKIKVKYTNPDAKKFGLRYAYKGDAGFDLYAVLPEDKIKDGLTIYPSDRVLIPSGVKLQLPDEYWATIVHRSSTESKLRLRVIGATIDCGFRGDLFINVHNYNTYPIVVHHGDRLAQVILHRVNQFEFEEVDELDSSDRGEKGFGSSGRGVVNA